MNFNKKGRTLLIAVFITAGLAAAYYNQISNIITKTCCNFINYIDTAGKDQEQPLQQNSKNPDSKLIKQILQQRYMAAANQQAAMNRDSVNPENQEMIEDALVALHNAQDEQDRELAVMTLGEFSTDKGKEGILFALNDPDLIVREQAVSQIIEWGDPQMILSALNNDNSDIVAQTLESISEVDNAELIDRLHSLSSDKNEDIREAAKLALQLAED